MKYILIQTDKTELGTFNSATEQKDGYLCDNSLYPKINYGVCVISEVADDYETPTQIAGYNNQQSELRAKAYPIDSDPIFFQWQRGTKTEQEWLDAVAAVQAKYPYKEQV
jgi:hypothetical protein